MADRSPRQRAFGAGAEPEPVPVAPVTPTELPRRRAPREEDREEREQAANDATSPGREPSLRSGQQAQVHRLGQPFNRQSPFVVAFSAALGVLVAIAIGAAVYSIRSTLVLVFVALFIAVGLDPIVAALTRRHIRRPWAVVAVLLAAVCIVGAFVYSAISPINDEVNQLVKEVPKWRNELSTGNGTLGHLARSLNLSADLKNLDTAAVAKYFASGALGAGKVVLSTAASTIIVIVLTIYFLAALPSIKHFFAQLVPRTRRDRFDGLLDEVLAGVGGYLIGNLITSVVAGVGTYLWAIAFGIPYPLLLGLLVALFDLIPVIGSTIAGIIVALVALAVSLPAAIATAVFYIGYRFFEDYLLVPRVMRQAVNVSPVVTILAVLIGGALLGIVGALVAIPVAASIKLVLEQRVFPRLDSN